MSATLKTVCADFKRHYSDELKAGRAVTPMQAVEWTYARVTDGAEEPAEAKPKRGRPAKKGKQDALREELAALDSKKLIALAKGKVVNASRMKKDLLVEALVSLGVKPA